MSEMNPDIVVVKIGKKDLFDLTIYPLSASDQIKFSQQFADVVLDLANMVNLKEAEVVAKITYHLENNLIEILDLVTEKNPDLRLTEQITNRQLTEIANIIWSVNYETSIKNGKALIQKISEAFPKATA